MRLLNNKIRNFFENIIIGIAGAYTFAVLTSSHVNNLKYSQILFIAIAMVFGTLISYLWYNLLIESLNKKRYNIVSYCCFMLPLVLFTLYGLVRLSQLIFS